MSYVCPVCERESHHPLDEWFGWCSACDRFTGKTDPELREIIDDLDEEGHHSLALSLERRLDRTGAA